MKVIAAIFFAGLLSACATVDTTGSKNPATAATVVGQMDRHGGVSVWRSFIPLSVDSRAVKHGFWGDPQDTVVHVEPGTRRITLRAAFNTGFGSDGPWESIVLLTTPVEAGKAYRINGEVRDNTFVVWLEDTKSGTRLREEGVGTWSRLAPSPTMIPVFIPN